MMVRLVWSYDLQTTLTCFESMFQQLGGVPEKITTGLWDFHSTHRLRIVSAFQQFLFEARPILFKIRTQILYRHLIDTGGSFVRHGGRLLRKIDP